MGILPFEPTAVNWFLLSACGLGVLVLVRRIAARSSSNEPVLFPHGPVEMKMDGSEHTFTAPDKTLMRMLWREIYDERCYDSAPLTPLDALTAEAKKKGRDVVVFDVGGNIGVFGMLACLAPGGASWCRIPSPQSAAYLTRRWTRSSSRRPPSGSSCARRCATPPPLDALRTTNVRRTT